MNVFV